MVVDGNCWVYRMAIVSAQQWFMGNGRFKVLNGSLWWFCFWLDGDEG